MIGVVPTSTPSARECIAFVPRAVQRGFDADAREEPPYCGDDSLTRRDASVRAIVRRALDLVGATTPWVVPEPTR